MIDGDDHDKTAALLAQAAQACASGDPALGMHLYLAAFEQNLLGGGSYPSEEALNGLKKAWALACNLKERSIAEYVFGRIEPYLSKEETVLYAQKLQELALDKLEEYGLSRDDMESLGELLSQELMDGESTGIVQAGNMGGFPFVALPAKGNEKPAEKDQGKKERTTRRQAPAEFGSYADLVGFDRAVSLMRDFGIGMQDDPDFQDLVAVLNDRHGLDGMPSADALLFRSPAREDANRFMTATAGELDLPVVRMRMEENMQGVPVLCVMSPAGRQPKLNNAHNRFEGPGVLLLEDLDLWVSPLPDQPIEDLNGFIMASLSRGAREAVTLIQSAMDSPEVFVLASAGDSCDVEPFFCDLLYPLTVVDIDYPDDVERADIWMEIAREHPSLRGIDRGFLVRHSKGMPRYDIYMAAREAIEESYRASLMSRRYEPVKADNLFDKLAAYQPLTSDEYQALEDAVVESFRRDLDDLDDLLKG